MRRCVIVGAAAIREYEEIRSCLREDDYFIFCDGGLRHMEGLGVQPDLIVGDFDSGENPHMNVETIVLPTVKDETDSAYAAGEAIKRGYREVLMLGVTGGREDHALVNLFLLFRFDSSGIRASIVDDCCEMSVVSREPAYVGDSYLYFSLVNMTGTAQGITVKHAKYELEDAKIESENQYATSNEVPIGRTAEITVKKGRLLLIKVRKEWNDWTKD